MAANILKNELEFQQKLISYLITHCGWDEVIENPSEEDLIKNWMQIICERNPDPLKLNSKPLIDSEIQQILSQIKKAGNPVNINNLINGEEISIRRENPEDDKNFGKTVYLNLFSRMAVGGGGHKYQIASQPRFKTESPLIGEKRGDFLLLINGIPFYHVELKAEGIDVSDATNQIERYAAAGIYQGFYSMVQIFIAMNPSEMKYFANPGPNAKFNEDFYFHWHDKETKEVVGKWTTVAEKFLSIPTAHQMVGIYSVADTSDHVLKVMRSYQYYGVQAILKKNALIPIEQQEDPTKPKGGFLWHTTGSGKTLTSFKAAHLLALNNEADKVIFLLDRIELGVQSFKQYQGFCSSEQIVTDTEDTVALMEKLNSISRSEKLIITSIQKMSNITLEKNPRLKSIINKINKKKLIFIVDECHRSVFGEMMQSIKHTFPNAYFYGFTGTPIKTQNQKKGNTTVSIFGDELHRYTIGDGIKDGNVLGFDVYKVLTFKDKDLRDAVAFQELKVNSLKEILEDQQKLEVYDQLRTLSMSEIEARLPSTQYQQEKHKIAVIEDIQEQFPSLSRGRFHAILTVPSIKEALEYYKLFKKLYPELKITSVFDSTIDNSGASAIEKEKGLVEILGDYNKQYEKNFTIPTHDAFKKDVAARLAHKQEYQKIHEHPEQFLDLVIVVNQMLTGFDSKWINTLYVDRVIENELIIQAFSRTNRVLKSKEKPHGTIRYYRKPHTMEQNIKEALKLYSGEEAYLVFVPKLPENLRDLNFYYGKIKEVFNIANIPDFSRLPEKEEDILCFVKNFNDLNKVLEAAKVQGFKWGKAEYKFGKNGRRKIKVEIDEPTYLKLLQCYKEIRGKVGPRTNVESMPFPIKTYLTEIPTGKIDAEYMNANFRRYYSQWISDPDSPQVQEILQELHSSFSSLSSEEQKYAEILLVSIQHGEFEVDPSKDFRQYLTDFISSVKDSTIKNFAETLGLDEGLLSEFVGANVTNENINVNSRFDNLLNKASLEVATPYINKIYGPDFPPFIGLDLIVREAILHNNFVLQDFDEEKENN